MGHIFLLIILFQYQLDSLSIDNRTRIELNNLKGDGVFSISFNPNEKEIYVYDQISGILSKKVNNRIINLDTLNPNLIGTTKIHYDISEEYLVFVDAGLGRIIKYDIDNKYLERIDNSYKMRSFYGFVGFFNDTGNVITYGGNGEFVRKNKTLIYNLHRQNEWWEDQSLIKSRGPSIDEKTIGLFENEGYYLFSLFNDDLIVRRTVFDKQLSKRWEKISKYEVRKEFTGGAYSDYSFSNYRSINDNLNVRGKYFYDVEKERLMRWETEFKVVGIYHSLNRDSVHVVYSNVLNDLNNPFEYEISTYSVKDFFENNSFETLESIEDRRIKIILLLIVLLVITVFTYTNLRQKSQTSTKPILITDNSVVVRVNNRKVVFSEKLEVDVFSLIEKLKVDEIDILELDQFDEFLFGDRGYRSNQTTKRKDVIEKINKNLDRDFITTIKSDSDKRRKMIVFDYSIFE